MNDFEERYEDFIDWGRYRNITLPESGKALLKVFYDYLTDQFWETADKYNKMVANDD